MPLSSAACDTVPDGEGQGVVLSACAARVWGQAGVKACRCRAEGPWQQMLARHGWGMRQSPEISFWSHWLRQGVAEAGQATGRTRPLPSASHCVQTIKRPLLQVPAYGGFMLWKHVAQPYMQMQSSCSQVRTAAL